MSVGLCYSWVNVISRTSGTFWMDLIVSLLIAHFISDTDLDKHVHAYLSVSKALTVIADAVPTADGLVLSFAVMGMKSGSSTYRQTPCM